MIIMCAVCKKPVKRVESYADYKDGSLVFTVYCYCEDYLERDE